MLGGQRPLSPSGDETWSQQEHELPAMHQLPTGATDAPHTRLAAGGLEQHPRVCQTRALPEGEEEGHRKSEESKVEDTPSSASAAEFMQPKSKTNAKSSQFVKATAVKSRAASKPAFRPPDFSSDPDILEEDMMEEDEEWAEIVPIGAEDIGMATLETEVLAQSCHLCHQGELILHRHRLEVQPWRMRTELPSPDWPNTTSSGHHHLPKLHLSGDDPAHTLRWRSQAPGIDLSGDRMQHEPLPLPAAGALHEDGSLQHRQPRPVTGWWLNPLHPHNTYM